MSIKKRRSISDIIDAYFEDIERWAEQFEETLMVSPSWNLKNCTLEPLREIMVAPTEVMMTVDLPYTEKNAVQVKPAGINSIEISAKMNKKIRLDNLGVTHCKGEFQKFHCHIRIPVPVNMNKMDIHYKRGILEIHIPRKR
jgi:HSP20 family molecular chaperone IbpA